MNHVRFAVALGIATAICSFGTAARADTTAADLTVVLPSTWTPYEMHGQPSIIAAWLSPIPAADGFRQNINVGRYPNDESVQDYVTDSLANFASSEPSLKVLHRGKNTVCADGTSETVELQETVKPYPTHAAITIDVVEVMTGSSGSIFIASYSRLPSSPADPEAIAAINKMCPAS